MGRRIRCYLPHVVYEITIRTVQGRYLLRPGQASRDLILGVLGRALTLYPSVSLHGFVYLSNHAHLLLSSDDAAAIPAFLCHVNGNVARKMGYLHQWSGATWDDSCTPIMIADSAALVARLRYVLSQSVKEGLVERPEEWPGASCVPWFLGKELAGTWVFREKETRALQRARHVDPATYTQRYAVPITPLPCWKNHSLDEIRARVRAMIEDLVEEARVHRAGPVLGARAAMATDPHLPRDEPSKVPAPLCHASTAAIRVAIKVVYRAFVSAFRLASEDVKSGRSPFDAQFPIGSSPRPGWFVSPPPRYLPPWMLPDGNLLVGGGYLSL